MNLVQFDIGEDFFSVEGADGNEIVSSGGVIVFPQTVVFPIRQVMMGQHGLIVQELILVRVGTGEFQLR